MPSSYTFATETPPTLEVRGSSGSVHITTAEVVTTTVELSRDSDQVTVEQVGERIVVRSRGRRVQAVITCPHDAVAVIAVGSARVAASGRLGGGEITAGSGDVVLETCRGQYALRLGSGRLSVEQLLGEAEISSGSGNVNIGRTEGSMRVKTGSGAIRLDQVAGSVVASSGSGTSSVQQLIAGELTITSASGTVRVGVAPGTTCWLDLSSVSGNVRNGLDETSAPEADHARLARIQISTVSGNIRITRFEP